MGEIGRQILNSNTEVISKAYIEHLFSVLKEKCLIPEVVDQKDDEITIKVSCPGMDDAYMTIQLRGWEFIQDDDDDEDEPEQVQEIKEIIDDMRKPRVTRVE